MKNYTKINNLLGWIVGIDCIRMIFIMTAEPTASFWDCGEFISCSYKLEVGHPPGAPTFLLLNRIASLFAGGNVLIVARLMNYLCAIASGLAVMFLFWIITYIAKKFFGRNEEELSTGNMYAVFGSGLVGAMAFTFSDSFGFLLSRRCCLGYGFISSLPLFFGRLQNGTGKRMLTNSYTGSS